MIKILLTGSDGQLGQAIVRENVKNVELIKTTRKDLNLLHPSECYEMVKKLKPDWIINTAAYTDVEKAEIDIKKAFKVNCEAVRQFAIALKEFGGRILHISTDFVFDGRQNIPYLPSSKKNPLNVYGKSKAAGEEEIKKILRNTDQGIILRTSWLMSHEGENFTLKILDLMNRQNRLNVINDQTGSPTFTSDLAPVCWKIIQDYEFLNKGKIPEARIFHYSNDGSATWYEIAKEIYKFGKLIKLIDNEVDINPISYKKFPSNVKRPNYSVLNSMETYRLLDLVPKDWKKTLYGELLKLKEVR